MKKSLLALAVFTAVSGAASAQSSVTLYGKIDLGMVYDSGSPAGKSIRLSSGVSGGSRLGFKGVEDLGGGTKMAFQLETGFCADQAGGTSQANPGSAGYCTGGGFMGRQAHGDLTGSFGALGAGRQYTLGFNNLATIDPFGAGYAGQADNISAAGVWLVDPSGLRQSNTVTYSTPTVAGLTASAELGLGEQTGNWRANRETGAGVNYAAGPAYVGVTFYNLENPAGLGPAEKVLTVGGTYDFGRVKIHALGQKVTGATSATLDTVNLLAGLTVPIGKASLLASYVRHNDRTAANQDATQYGIGLQYPLSKRTAVYSSFARIANQRGAAFLVGNATELGTGDKAFNIGVAHDF